MLSESSAEAMEEVKTDTASTMSTSTSTSTSSAEAMATSASVDSQAPLPPPRIIRVRSDQRDLTPIVNASTASTSAATTASAPARAGESAATTSSSTASYSSTTAQTAGAWASAFLATATNALTAAGSTAARTWTAATAAASVATRAPTRNAIASSPAYLNFRATVPLTKIAVGTQSWSYLSMGNREQPTVVLLHGTTGTAFSFFYQVLSLASKGYHVVSAQYPAYESVAAWLLGFDAFLDAMRIEQCHLVGTSLGGFLALHYATTHVARVSSLVLIHAFLDNTPFVQPSYFVQALAYTPQFALRKSVLDSLPRVSYYPHIVDFMVEQVDTLSHAELASRLALNYVAAPISKRQLEAFDASKITVIDSLDDVTLPSSMTEQLHTMLASAKLALLKQGGDFPYLSVPDEVSLHLSLHLRTHAATTATATATAATAADDDDKL